MRSAAIKLVDAQNFHSWLNTAIRSFTGNYAEDHAAIIPNPTLALSRVRVGGARDYRTGIACYAMKKCITNY